MTSNLSRVKEWLKDPEQTIFAYVNRYYEKQNHLLKNSIDNYRTFVAIFDEIKEESRFKKHQEI